MWKDIQDISLSEKSKIENNTNFVEMEDKTNMYLCLYVYNSTKSQETKKVIQGKRMNTEAVDRDVREKEKETSNYLLF